MDVLQAIMPAEVYDNLAQSRTGIFGDYYIQKFGLDIGCISDKTTDRLLLIHDERFIAIVNPGGVKLLPEIVFDHREYPFNLATVISYPQDIIIYRNLTPDEYKLLLDHKWNSVKFYTEEMDLSLSELGIIACKTLFIQHKNIKYLSMFNYNGLTPM